MNKEINKNFRILVVDDEPLIRESLFEILRIEGYRVQMASSAEDALVSLDGADFDIVLTDMKLPRMSGLALLEKIKQISPITEVIIITGYGSIETAVEAVKMGAYDYITKPINDSEIKVRIEKIIERRRIVDENERLREELALERPRRFAGMIGGCTPMQKVYQTIRAVAPTNATILITGQSGTGKGLIARAIHEYDRHRKNKPFIEISCGALTETLLESELFGHVKGAFTGAIRDKKGRFEYADGGTIFLDEIDTFSLNLQVKLLRVLQDGVFERVGDNVTMKSDARIIVATNQSLPKLVAEGRFREDLYYRINVIAIEPPPLNERREDIPLLIEHFVKVYAEGNGKKITEVADELVKIFQDYEWPGNIRELENAIEGAVIMAQGEVIRKEEVPSIDKFINARLVPVKTAASWSSAETSLKKAVEEPEKEHIIAILNEFHWNRSKAAEKLGVNRTTLYNKMKKYNITDPG